MMDTNLVENRTALSIRHVTKAFGSKNGHPFLGSLKRRLGRANGNGHDAPKRVMAVDDVSLEVPRREVFGVLGPNGSGKSTLIRLMATLLVPDEGRIEVFGLDIVRHEMEVKRLINRVSVDAAFFKKLSGIENLMYAARLYGLSGREARQHPYL